MMSFLNQMFKSTDKAVATGLDMADEMGMGRLVSMKDRAQNSDESHKDILTRVKSAELGDSAKQMRFRKPEAKAPLYTDWTNRLSA